MTSPSSKLVAPGLGLLQTHIDWDDMQRLCESAFGTEATFGQNKSVTNISLGKGSCSRLALINPDWQNQQDKDLPKEFVVKIPSIMNMIEINTKKAEDGGSFWAMGEEVENMWEKQCRKLLNTECTVYDVIKSTNSKNIKIPKIFATNPFKETNDLKGNIIIEFIRSDDFRIEDNLSFEEFKPILKSIAAIQAMGSKFDESVKNALLPNNEYEIFATIFPEETKKNIIAQFYEMDSGSLPKNLIDKLAKIIDRLLSHEYLKEIDNLSGIPKIFCHGDFWPSNILWKGREVQAIIDWQTSHFGALATDLCRFLPCAMSGRERREKLADILSTLHRYMVEEMGGKELYSLEQLKTSFDHMMPVKTFIALLTIQLYFDFDREKLKPNNIEIVDRAKEKTLALLEDTIEIYEKIHGTIDI
ncbi:hypothetical protein WR25_04832 [Diploscapter pachys]|uniref:CHK kinase-like domain-containing protein n=1 Tax=Diploscapter pachys TaxID=2018661 RepID=A0A2A2J703_9BILA|nr:hypothetical protein WR25_04832 [Diploscapter pachys]